MFYLNTIEQLFLLVEQLDQLEVCLHYRRRQAGIPILAVFQNLRWNSNKISLCCILINDDDDYKYFKFLTHAFDIENVFEISHFCLDSSYF